MESTSEAVTVRREIAIAARPETVWEFLVDPEKTTRWMGLRAELDPTPGGTYVVEVQPGNTARGEFVEVDPPHRLVFTFGWEPSEAGASAVPPGSSRIEIDLAPDGHGGTLLRFLHELPTLEEARKHEHGWNHYLDRLAVTAGGGDAGEDPWLREKP